MKRFLSRIIALIMLSSTVAAHETIPHSGTVEAMATEKLLPANVPVTDMTYQTKGFVSRFRDSGTLIISFTYTNCESMCPLTNAILSGVDQALPSESRITIVTLSIDPVQDTPANLKQSAQDLGASDRWVWLTAAEADHRLLMDGLDVEVATLADHDPMFLIGDVCSGQFSRLIGLPDPDQLLELARSHPPCSI